MSKIEVDKIDPQSGTDLELGTSGDTITIPAGVTFDSSAATNTLPATVVTTDGTQTLTNKSIATTQLTGTITPSDSSVTTAKIVDANVTTAKIADANVTLAKLSATGTKNSTTFLRGDNTFDTPPLGGITEADMWRISANKSSASGSTFTANWERADTYGYDKLGTGMTESSGIFTFPSTGHYRVSFIGRFTGANIQYAGLMMMVTTDNSTYNQYAKTYTSLDTSGDETFAYVEAFIDVTNTTNVKVKLDQQMAGSDGAWQGNTSQQMTGATFLKLADT